MQLEIEETALKRYPNIPFVYRGMNVLLECLARCPFASEIEKIEPLDAKAIRHHPSLRLWTIMKKHMSDLLGKTEGDMNDLQNWFSSEYPKNCLRPMGNYDPYFIYQRIFEILNKACEQEVLQDRRVSPSFIIDHFGIKAKATRNILFAAEIDVPSSIFDFHLEFLLEKWFQTTQPSSPPRILVIRLNRVSNSDQTKVVFPKKDLNIDNFYKGWRHRSVVYNLTGVIKCDQPVKVDDIHYFSAIVWHDWTNKFYEWCYPKRKYVPRPKTWRGRWNTSGTAAMLFYELNTDILRRPRTLSEPQEFKHVYGLYIAKIPGPDAPTVQRRNSRDGDDDPDDIDDENIPQENQIRESRYKVTDL